jgi:ethanolamine ammonia-lyase small subunit
MGEIVVRLTYPTGGQPIGARTAIKGPATHSSRIQLTTRSDLVTMTSDQTADYDPWRALRAFTSARIALGRAGGSLTTRAQLDFQLAHARARDAVHARLDLAKLESRLREAGYDVLSLRSAAEDRQEYLQRPDLGRRLHAESLRALAPYASPQRPFDAAFVIADGLSALAVERHAVPLLALAAGRLGQEGWRFAPVAIVERGRVAIGDEIAHALAAEQVAVLIGERPGLSAPDSLGVYLTYGARPGVRDADRNCISNIRAEGLSYELAAHKLCYLMREARRRRLTGVALKEDAPSLEEGGPRRTLPGAQ